MCLSVCLSVCPYVLVSLFIKMYFKRLANIAFLASKQLAVAMCVLCRMLHIMQEQRSQQDLEWTSEGPEERAR